MNRYLIVESKEKYEKKLNSIKLTSNNYNIQENSATLHKHLSRCIKNFSYIQDAWSLDIILDCLFTLEFLTSKTNKDYNIHSGTRVSDAEGNLYFTGKKNSLLKPLVIKDCENNSYYADLFYNQLLKMHTTNARTYISLYRNFPLSSDISLDGIYENYIIEKSSNIGYIFCAKKLLNKYGFLDNESISLKTG